jgi:hypothetical protein
MDQQKRHPAHGPLPDPDPDPVPVPVPDPVLVHGVMSLSEFEAAVSDQAAARHAYLDALQAGLPACEAGKTNAVNQSNYDEAASLSAIAKAARDILACLEKPRSKADIKASLDGGIIAHIEQAETIRHLSEHREWQREADAAKFELERGVKSAKEEADRKTTQLLDQERAAAAKDDFALAKKMKEARETSTREGESAVNEVRTELQVGCCMPLVQRCPPTACPRVVTTA